MTDPWDTLWEDVDSFFKAVARNAAVNINANELRQQGREIVVRYFRQERPKLVALGIKAEALDVPMQALIRLANGKNARASYLTVLRRLRKQRPKTETEREILLGALTTKRPEEAFTNRTEIEIFQTLDRLVPTAAASYHQALQDLQDPERPSWRGTADELRETVREVLDHLAPDADVVKAEGFTLEKGRTRPTMSQKARFILKSRGIPHGATRGHVWGPVVAQARRLRAAALCRALSRLRDRRLSAARVYLRSAAKEKWLTSSATRSNHRSGRPTFTSRGRGPATSLCEIWLPDCHFGPNHVRYF